MSGFLERIKGVFHRKEEDEKAMYIIAGLGNPTKEYEKTRHNVGFEVIDVLADRLFTSVDEKKVQGILRQGGDRRGESDSFKAPDLHESQRGERARGGGFL